MKFWRDNKGAVKGGLTYRIKGFFQQLFAVATAPVIDTPDCIIAFQGLIDATDSAFQGLIDDTSTASQGLITDTAAFQGIIIETVPFQGAIDNSANAFNGEIDDSPIGLEGKLCL